MIKFILLVNKQGQTRLSKYFEWKQTTEKLLLEGEIVRKCIRRTQNNVSFVLYKDVKAIYKRFASLYFIIGVSRDEENDMIFLDLIQFMVETLDKYFGNVCELDILYHLEKAHFIVDEIVTNGEITETNQELILKQMKAFDAAGAEI